MAGKYEKNDWKFLRFGRFVTISSRLDIRFLVDDYENGEDEQEEGTFEAMFALFAEEFRICTLRRSSFSTCTLVECDNYSSKYRSFSNTYGSVRFEI